MLNINEVLSLKHLWGDYLPKKILIFIIPLGIAIHFMADKKTWVFFWLFTLFAITTEAMKYAKCQKKHRALIMEFGDRYIEVLEQEIDKIGVNGLIDRYWFGLEPK